MQQAAKQRQRGTDGKNLKQIYFMDREGILKDSGGWGVKAKSSKQTAEVWELDPGGKKKMLRWVETLFQQFALRCVCECNKEREGAIQK